MTNGEKYKEEIKKFYPDDGFCENFIKPKILKEKSCADVSCAQCRLIQTIWINEEYKEPEVDWTKVPIDTKILVKNNKYDEWSPRYFARYENNVVYAFSDGRTNFSTEDESVTPWNYAKLAEGKNE